ncbi:MAG: homocysteine S-methyltransferase family protein [Opitutales bacterium]
MNLIGLLDGGMGQELQKRSHVPAHPLWSVAVMRTDPDSVRDAHAAFIRAGARMLTLNTYAATPQRLSRDGDPGWLEDLHATASRLAREAREATGEPHGPVDLLGCLPPPGGSYTPETVPSAGDCLATYRELVALQADAVDGFLAETLGTIREAEAAAEAALPTGKPVLISFSLSDDSPECLRSGERLADAVAALRSYPIQGLLLNCSRPETIGQGLPALAESGYAFGAYANGFESVDALKPGGTVDALTARVDLDPEAYGAIALSWVQDGATWVGGCCEVGPDHIERLAALLRANGCEPAGLGVSRPD